MATKLEDVESEYISGLYSVAIAFVQTLCQNGMSDQKAKERVADYLSRMSTEITNREQQEEGS